jgi:AraC-like DNA-binding protein/mannose-6-phosphate isomerase-like protein (cupin superfamily)
MIENGGARPTVLFTTIGDLRVDFLIANPNWAPMSIANSPVHLHTKHEFQFILSGRLQVRIDENEVLEVPQGSAVLIPPNILHSNQQSDGQRLIATIALQPLYREEKPDFSEFHYYCALFSRVREPLVLQSETITNGIRQVVQLRDQPQDLHRRNNLLAYLFIQLGLAVEHQCGGLAEESLLQLGNQYNYQYFVIEQHINKNYNKQTSAEEIAAALHMSRRQIDRIVKQIWGKTYAMLILERRMLIAQKLLQKTDMPCTRVAERVGYTSYPGFYLAFRRYFDMTPEEMRGEAL